MVYHRRVVLVRLAGFAAAFGMVLACKDKQVQTRSAQSSLAELTFDADSITAQDSADLDHAVNSAALSTTWHDAPCDGCKAKGEVQIRAIAKTTDIQAHNGPAHRRFVAAVRNISKEDVKHGPSQFVFKAGGTYLLYIARADTGSNAVWGLTRLRVGHIQPRIGALEECEHVPNPSRIDDANFYNCGDVHTTSSRISFVKTAYATPRPLLEATILKRGWISCDPDCCTGAGTFTGTTY